jgi:hypothetical protein
MHSNKFVTSRNFQEIISGKLWKVTSPNGAINFMSGTYHPKYGGSHINTLSPELLTIISETNEVMLEMSNRSESIKHLAELLLLQIDLITHPACNLAHIEIKFPELFAFAHKILTKFLANDIFKQSLVNRISELPLKTPIHNIEQLLEIENFRQLSIYPIMYFSHIYNTYPPSDWNKLIPQTVDNSIKAYAATQNKTIIPLETLQSRFKAFFALSKQEQFDIFCQSEFHDSKSTFQESESTLKKHFYYMQYELKQKFNEIIISYKYISNRLFSEETFKQPLVAVNAFDRYLLVTRIERDKQMFNQFINKFDQGNKLVSVGQAHYTYSDGLIAKLLAHGYVIERIYETPNILYMYKFLWALSTLAGCFATLHPRLRMIGKLSFYGATIPAIALSVDTINSNRPPQTPFLWAASKAINAGINKFKSNFQQKPSSLQANLEFKQKP